MTFTFEVDGAGNNRWQPLRKVKVPATGYAWASFDANEKGAWIRARVDHDIPNATVFFQYSNEDRRTPEADSMFAGLAKPGDKAVSGGLLWARGDNKRTLCRLPPLRRQCTPSLPTYMGYRRDLALRPVNEPPTLEWIQENVAIPKASCNPTPLRLYTLTRRESAGGYRRAMQPSTCPARSVTVVSPAK